MSYLQELSVFWERGRVTGYLGQSVCEFVDDLLDRMTLMDLEPSKYPKAAGRHPEI